MIADFGAGPDPGFNRFLEGLNRESVVEETATGLAYFVSDQLIDPTAVVGRISRAEDGVDVELYMSAGLQESTRRLVAQACFDSQEWTDENSVARACDAISVDLDEPERHLMIAAVALNLEGHRLGFAERQKRHEAVHPLTRAQFRSAMGWVGLRKPFGERGLELLDQLEKASLMVPMAEEGSLVARSLAPDSRGATVEVRAMTEKGHRHRCKCCSGNIPKETLRITESLDRLVNGYDHHHFHPSCFFDKELGTLDLKTARLMPAVPTLGSKPQ